MADHAVCRGHIANPGCAVVAVRTGAVSHACVKGFHHVAVEAVGLDVVIGERGGGRSRPAAALGVTGNTISGKAWVMPLNQVTTVMLMHFGIHFLLVAPEKVLKKLALLNIMGFLL